MIKAALTLCLLFIPTILGSIQYNTYFGKRTTPVFPRSPQVYDINLDLSFEDQWRGILQDFEEEILHFIDGFGIKAKVPLEILDLLAYPVFEDYDSNFAQEAQAVANLLSIPFSEAVLLNLLYDITAECTSIIVQDPQGNVYHGRNLDFPYAPELSNMIFQGRYFRNGELLYEAISIAGYTGLITAVKPGAYSFSIDQYSMPKNETTIWEDVANVVLDISQAFKKKLSPPIVAKRALETISTFDDLVNYLKTTQTMSRVFYIAAGTKPGEGVAITRFRNTIENVTSLNPDTSDGWYLVQTNYIGDVPDPSFDDRATAARNWLNAIGRDYISKDLLLNDIFSIYPVFNNLTIHSTIMQPSSDYFNTTIWGWGW